MQNCVTIKNLHKTYVTEVGNKVKALSDINLQIAQGKFVTLLGPTGCGKSTILNTIAGLIKQDKGQIQLDNNLAFGKNIASVFQHYTLLPWRNVIKNVTFSMQMQGIKRNLRNQQAAQLLNEVGLDGFEYSKIHELSGGMRQRAAIAQALALKPELLLMDEPFGALDEITRSDLQQMLIKLWQLHNMTTIFVTHSIDEALILSDQIIVLSGRPGKIIKKYDITLPRPRNKLSKEFTDLFIDVRKTLSQN
ncbi:MAG: ABC transporter ATP-binding protein [Phycisphaerae bacterium]|nr:ABC transporter ATP-binding protein [Phycisphaerae bacterium]